MKTIYVSNVRKEDGTPMTKAEVITRLLEASLAGGYRFTDRAEECYDGLVKNGIYIERELADECAVHGKLSPELYGYSM